MQRLTLFFKTSVTVIVVAGALSFFFYPSFVCLRLAADKAFREGDIPSYVFPWFNTTSVRFEKWARHYLSTRHAETVDHEDVAATEWPVFGSVFYLLTAEEMNRYLNARNDAGSIEMRKNLFQASRAAADVVASPTTAAWVRKKWGKTYLDKENLFYRMLLIMGLGSYENITQDKIYRGILEKQTRSLAKELLEAPYHLLDDYPGECYPHDVLWAVAAIGRADRLLGTDHSQLKRKFMGVLNQYTLTEEGVPAFIVDKNTADKWGPPRGCNNSGILNFAYEIDPETAKKWYARHEEFFWHHSWFVAGFREMTRDYPGKFQDVDSGLVVMGLGTAASAFGIGAARVMGRYDHSVPVSQQAVACSWPTPFGCVVPSVMGYLAVESSVLGETALLFCMTRPTLADQRTPYKGPGTVFFWMISAGYFLIGLILLLEERRSWKRYFQKSSLN